MTSPRVPSELPLSDGPHRGPFWAYLRVTSLQLQPGEITQALGVEPDESHGIGEADPDSLGTYKWSVWSRYLVLDDAVPWGTEALTAAIEALGGGLADRLGELARTSCEVSLMVVQELYEDCDSGLFLTAAAVDWLARAGARVDVDQRVFGPEERDMAAHPGPAEVLIPFDRPTVSLVPFGWPTMTPFLPFAPLSDGPDRGPFWAYVRVTSFQIQPHEITQALGVEPDESHDIGNTNPYSLRAYKWSMWSKYLVLDDAVPLGTEALTAAIEALGGGLADRLGELGRTSCEVDLSVVQELDEESDLGIPLTAAAIGWLARAGAYLDIDQYVFLGPDEDDE